MHGRGGVRADSALPRMGTPPEPSLGIVLCTQEGSRGPGPLRAPSQAHLVCVPWVGAPSESCTEEPAGGFCPAASA